MKYFQLVGQVDPIPLLVALHRQPHLWNRDTVRTKHPGTAHADVSDILVRFNDTTGDVVEDKECFAKPAWFSLPQLHPMIFDLMRRVTGVRLGRVIITKLPPGKSIMPHVDGGAPATYYTRYQIALQSGPGALFHIADETVTFKPGEVWLIDNEAEHAVVNNSDDDRIAVIVDIRS